MNRATNKYVCVAAFPGINAGSSKAKGHEWPSLGVASSCVKNVLVFSGLAAQFLVILEVVVGAAGGFRLTISTFLVEPPQPSAGLDLADAMAEAKQKLPGLLSHVEPDNPGMHTTTVYRQPH